MVAGLVCDNRDQARKIAHALWLLGIKPPHVHRDGADLLIQHETLTQAELEAVTRCVQAPHGARDITWKRVNDELHAQTKGS